MPCPSVYQGASRARYCVESGSSQGRGEPLGGSEGTYDIRGDRAVEVAEGDDHGDGNATLVRALNVV